MLEELVVYLVLSLFRDDACVVQVIELLLRFLECVRTYLLANNLHMEVDVEVLDFEFLFETFRFLLILHHNVLRDFILDVQEVLEPIDGLVFLLVVGKRWQLRALELYLEVARRVVDL